MRNEVVRKLEEILEAVDGLRIEVEDESADTFVVEALCKAIVDIVDPIRKNFQKINVDKLRKGEKVITTTDKYQFITSLRTRKNITYDYDTAFQLIEEELGIPKDDFKIDKGVITYTTIKKQKI